MKPEQIPEKLNKALFIAINDIVVGELGKNTPVKTGDTAANWDVDYGNELGTFIIFNKRGEIVQYLEGGTKAHTIVPNTKKMLKFPLKKAPTFKNQGIDKQFKLKGKIFFYKNKIPILGYVKEGSKYYCFAKKVKHPGTEARHFVRDTLNNQGMWDRVKARAKELL